MTRVLVNKVRVDNSASPPGVTLLTDTYTPTDTLHLLVGRLDGVLVDDVANVNVTDDLKTNIENSEALWVSIGHQTGHVTTAENGWTIDDPTSTALRYLTGEPILARAPSSFYIFRKKIVKHRIRIGVAAAAVVVGISSLFGGIWWKQYSLRT